MFRLTDKADAAALIDPNRSFSPTGLVFVLLLGSVLSWRAQFFVPGPNSGFAAPVEAAEIARGENTAPARPAIEPVIGPRYVIEATGSRAIQATLSVEVQTSPFAADEWVVFAARPPALPSQAQAAARLTPGGDGYLEPAPPHRWLLRSRLKANGSTSVAAHHLRVRVDYHATLIARRLVVRDPSKTYPVAESLSPGERFASLEANALIDYRSPDFQAWLRATPLGSRGKNSDVDFGRRVFLHLSKTLHYEYAKDMDRQASHVCRTGRSDCAGMSVLFVAAMRSHGIPARVLAGRWARSSKPGQMVGQVKYYQQHVRAEFYAAGVGWVPVDLSSAIERDSSPDGLQFFGEDRGDFLVLHVDPLIRADTVHFGQKTFNWLQGVQYWVSGHGALTDRTLAETWHVEPVIHRNAAPSDVPPRIAED